MGEGSKRSWERTGPLVLALSRPPHQGYHNVIPGPDDLDASWDYTSQQHWDYQDRQEVTTPSSPAVVRTPG
jgi:hypothetical protein